MKVVPAHVLRIRLFGGREAAIQVGEVAVLVPPSTVIVITAGPPEWVIVLVRSGERLAILIPQTIT